jgi:hypothetical protein
MDQLTAVFGDKGALQIDRVFDYLASERPTTIIAVHKV